MYSNDFDAKWTVKAGKLYYDYKLHMSTDSYNGFIKGGHITSANCSEELLKVVEETKPEKGSYIPVDKGYASKNNRNQLNLLGFKDGIMHKATSGKKLTQIQKFINSKISSVRGIVERTFGTLNMVK